MNTRLFTAFSILTAFIAIFGTAPETVSSQESDVAIEVNGETVKKPELERTIDQTYQKMKQRFGKKLQNKNKKNQLRKRVRDQVIQREVNRLVLKTKAEESNVSVSEKQVQSKLQETKQRFESEEQFRTLLKKRGFTPDEFRQQVREQLLVQSFLESKIGETTISDKEARQYYKKNKNRFKGRSFEELKPRLKQVLKKRKSRKQQQDLVSKLKEDSEINIRV